MCTNAPAGTSINRGQGVAHHPSQNQGTRRGCLQRSACKEMCEVQMGGKLELSNEVYAKSWWSVVWWSLRNILTPLLPRAENKGVANAAGTNLVVMRNSWRYSWWVLGFYVAYDTCVTWNVGNLIANFFCFKILLRAMLIFALEQCSLLIIVVFQLSILGQLRQWLRYLICTFRTQFATNVCDV